MRLQSTGWDGEGSMVWHFLLGLVKEKEGEIGGGDFKKKNQSTLIG